MSQLADGGDLAGHDAFAQGGSPMGGKDQAPPRREVRGEGRWLPSVVTGADGKAMATIKMPETTTAWRLTARGCSVETLVGQATATTLTRKDFFVELKTPSFLREGDEVRVVGRVHNLTDFAGTVPLTLRIFDPKNPSKVLATREKSVEVKAKGGAEVAFDAFVIPNLLNVTFELSGSAGEQKDSLELDDPRPAMGTSLRRPRRWFHQLGHRRRADPARRPRILHPTG